MGDNTCDVNQNSKVVAVEVADVVVHSGPDGRPVVVGSGDGGGGDDIEKASDKLKTLSLGTTEIEPDKGDDSSTTSSGVSSGGSTSITGSTASPDKDDKRRKFDVSLDSWNIWKEDIEYAPASDSDDDSGGGGSISDISGLRRFREPRSAGSATLDSKKSRFSFLRRLSLRDSRELNAPKRESFELRPPPKRLSLPELKIETLPQYFVVKHLGFRRSTGLYGMQHVRGPVDAVVTAVSNMRRGQEVTLAQLHITRKGVHMSTHADNRGVSLDAEFIPLQFISYAVQDTVHPRIFCLMVVRTAAPNGQKAECHAFACNRSATAKRLALAMRLAFEKYAESLQGKPQRLHVDLHAGRSSTTTSTSARDKDGSAGKAIRSECDA